MNITEFNNKIYGLEPGFKTGQNDRVDELNDRILARISCDVPLKPNLNVRAQSTKYSYFHIIDESKPAKIKSQPFIDHSAHFCPIQGRGPVSGFNVGAETDLIRPAVSFNDIYIPSSTSDLYNVSLPNPSREDVQPFLGLFDHFRMNHISTVRNENPKIGNELFLNHTRTQLRNS
jgi:hypothetical protein